MSDVKYRFKGEGVAFYGIPARDLTEADYARLTIRQQRIVRESADYAEVKAPKPSKQDDAPKKDGDK